MSLIPPVLQGLFLLYQLLIHFVEGSTNHSNLVFRESCHQDTPWLHVSSILRMPVPFVTVAIALSLPGHWGALSLHAPVPAVAKTGPVEGREMLKKPEKNWQVY